MKRTVIALPSDTQCGCSFGLMPPDPWNLVTGGTHYPSPLQKVLWKQWAEGWERVKELRQGGRLIVVFNGDATQGDSFQSAELVTRDIEEQCRIHETCMDWALQTAQFNSDKKDLLYYIQGTRVHSGSAGQTEERIARDFNAVPFRKGTEENGYRDGRYTWPEKKLKIAGTNVILDLAHKGVRPGTRAWARDNSLNSLLKSVYFDCVDYGIPVPRYWIRGHHHKYTEGTYRGNKGTIDGFILPCFAFHDEYMVSVVGEQLTTVGMLIIVVEENGRSFWECPRITVDEKETEIV